MSSAGGATPRGSRPGPVTSIRHALAHIASDGSQELPVRILPTVRAELTAGRVPTGAARVLAAWVLHLRGSGAPVTDVRSDEVAALAGGTLEDSVARVLAYLGRSSPTTGYVQPSFIAH